MLGLLEDAVSMDRKEEKMEVDWVAAGRDMVRGEVS